VAVDDVLQVEKAVRQRVTEELPKVCEAVQRGDELKDEQLNQMETVIKQVVKEFSE
jgi:F0F1-type ATP synthase alpha subunit